MLTKFYRSDRPSSGDSRWCHRHWSKKWDMWGVAVETKKKWRSEETVRRRRRLGVIRAGNGNWIRRSSSSPFSSQQGEKNLCGSHHFFRPCFLSSPFSSGIQTGENVIFSSIFSSPISFSPVFTSSKQRGNVSYTLHIIHMCFQM